MTVVEILAASAVTAAIMAGVLGALVPAQALMAREAARVDAVQRLRFTVDTLTRQIREATLVAPAGEGIEVRRGTAQRVFYLAADAGQLRQVDAGGVDLPVIDGVAALAFAYEPGAVGVTLVMRAGRETLGVAWHVALRNPP